MKVKVTAKSNDYKKLLS